MLVDWYDICSIVNIINFCIIPIRNIYHTYLVSFSINLKQSYTTNYDKSKEKNLMVFSSSDILLVMKNAKNRVVFLTRISLYNLAHKYHMLYMYMYLASIVIFLGCNCIYLIFISLYMYARNLPTGKIFS